MIDFFLLTFKCYSTTVCVFLKCVPDSCTVTQYSLDFPNEELDLTKTTPKRSTYEEENNQWLHLRWSELDSQGEMALDSFSCCCHLKLPQQVALTAFNKQVNTQVGVIGRTEFFSNSSWTVWRGEKNAKSATIPQQIALTAFRNHVCACVRVKLVKNHWLS